MRSWDHLSHSRREMILQLLCVTEAFHHQEKSQCRPRMAKSPILEACCNQETPVTLRVKTNVVLEDTDGRQLLDSERFRILKFVRETGSISKAARKMRLPFRGVWGKLKALEDDCGFKVLTSSRNGSQLTEACEGLYLRYEELSKSCERSAKSKFRKLFGL
jgi:molybdate transport system regulatory protein